MINSKRKGSTSSDGSSIEVIDTHSFDEETENDVKRQLHPNEKGTFENKQEEINRRLNELDGLLPPSTLKERANLQLTVLKQKEVIATMNEEMLRMKALEEVLTRENEIHADKNLGLQSICEELEFIEEQANHQRRIAFADGKISFVEKRVTRMHGIKKMLGMLWGTYKSYLIGGSIGLVVIYSTLVVVGNFAVNLMDNYKHDFMGPILIDLQPSFTENDNQLFVAILKHGNYKTLDEFATALKTKSPDLYEIDYRRAINSQDKLNSLGEEARKFANEVVELSWRFRERNFPRTRISTKQFYAMLDKCIIRYKSLSKTSRMEFDRQFPETAYTWLTRSGAR